MPAIVTGNMSGSSSYDRTLLERDLGYTYPYDLDLRPGTELHAKIKDEILNRARESYSVVSNRFSSWNSIEQVMTAYIDLDEEEEDIQDADSRKPVSIVFPYTYIIIETVLTYLVTALLGDPIFRYDGTSPEDLLGVALLEKVVQKQCDYFKVALALHTFLRDALVYGLGVAAPYWEVKEGTYYVRTLLGALLGKKSIKRQGVIFEGNALENVDPYTYLPDPNVAAHKVQEGEYVGWLFKTSLPRLKRDEGRGNSDLFNVKYLNALKSRKSSICSASDSAREDKSGTAYRDYTDFTSTNRVDVIYMYVDLIPSEWKLGDSDKPEKWLFGLAGDEIVVKAKKLGLSHGMYPIVTAAPDFDGYSVLPIARSEVLYGMQHVLDFMFNSHISNVRKALNDMFVVDPFLININDLKDPRPGKLIRLRRPAWGKGVKDAVQQFQVNDITRNNLADSAIIVQWMQMIGAADESLSGVLRKGGPERLTGTEFQGTRAGAIGRLERVARVIGLQAFHDLGYMFASHTQQLMSKEVYVKTVGRWQEELQAVYGSNYVKVTPYDISIPYDVEVKDGSIPNGSAQLWIRLYDILAKNQQLGQQFDMVRIFEHIAQVLGAKNVSDFKIKTKIMPNEQVLQQSQAGNIVPLAQYSAAVGGGA